MPEPKKPAVAKKPVPQSGPVNLDQYKQSRIFAEGLINRYPERYPKGTTPDDLIYMMQQINKAESPRGNVAQVGGGPGRGYYQMELASTPTAINRYKLYQQELKKKGYTVPDVPTPKGNDVRLLNLDQQTMLGLSNISGNAKSQEDKKVRKAFIDPRNPQDVWLNYHWAGDAKQRPARISHWERDVSPYFTPISHGHGGWVYPTNTAFPYHRKGGYILPGHTYPTYADGGVTFSSGGEKHRVYIKESPTGLGKGIEGHVMVNHPTMDKGKWDTIDLTEKAGAKTVAQGVAATKKWHRENPEYAKGGWIGYPDHTMYSSGMERFDRVRNYTKYADGGPAFDTEQPFKSYASDPKYFNSHAVYHDNPRFNDQIKKLVYAGTHEYNPETGELRKLKKPVNVPAEVKQMATQVGATPTAELFKKNPKLRKQYIQESTNQAFQNPLMYAPGAIGMSLLPGGLQSAIGLTSAAANLGQGNYKTAALEAGLSALPFAPKIYKINPWALAPVRSFNKSIIPSNRALGESVGTVSDIKALNPNIKQLRDPQTNKVLYQLEKEDYSFGNDWETIAPKDFKDYGTPYIDPLKGGSTDIPSFNKKLNDLRMSATHGKYPLEINAVNKGQLPVSKGLAKDLIGSQRYKEAPRFPGSEAREMMPVDPMEMFRRYYSPHKKGGWTGKPNPEAYYRMIGETGFDDAMSSNKIG